MLKFLISSLETFKSRYSTTITFGENLTRLKPLRTSSSCPSTSIESKSKLLFFSLHVQTIPLESLHVQQKLLGSLHVRQILLESLHVQQKRLHVTEMFCFGHSPDWLGYLSYCQESLHLQ